MAQKRSRSVTWTKKSAVKPTLALMMAGGLYGCSSEDDQTHLVTSIQDCLDQNYWTEEVCETAYAQALEESQVNAPRYDSETYCENDFGFGNCDYNRDGGWFYPAMTGFLLAEVIDEIGDLYKYKNKPKSVYAYRNRAGSGLMTLDAAKKMHSQSKAGKFSSSTYRSSSDATSRSGFGAAAARATSSLGS